MVFYVQTPNTSYKFFSFRVAECILACLHTNVCVIVYTYLYEYYI